MTDPGIYIEHDSSHLCRLMHPNDANVAGNVHGGTILKMIEEAGLIVSTRHCNEGAKTECLGVLARVEKTDFLLPMYVGEVAHLSAEITFCSDHSVEVQVAVVGENLITGNKRVTNKATLWYVPVTAGGAIALVPPMTYAKPEDEVQGRIRYERQKRERQEIDTNSPSMNDEWALTWKMPTQLGQGPHSVASAASALIHLVGVTDCSTMGKVPGGVVMKLMDEVAGIVAVRHCHTNVVTASMDAMDFHKSIKKGSILHIKGRPIFTSSRSLMAQVVVIVEERARLSDGTVGSTIFCGCSAFFTFVSLKDGKTQPIPALVLNNDGDRDRFNEGKERYMRQKQQRQDAVEKKKGSTE